ncbi:sodium-dependent bicarbonate transport family permease [Paenibacillus sambharensis]|uniref:Sodium-dependent bicarbonate transport family permease n=1 Tax=Paenibacillus sambharensis TaxID=1803190 RepID=A0A2W1LFN2_9BACL|nr:sodium-dependent bicarbonate transport family permease [Paenibacillus sambharensis]PZD97643.1 sodium-dependent bicarbonate transport family permease [Paenibacillus sambharensis]
MWEIVLSNMGSPAVLFFGLGMLAVLIKSDLKIPGGLTETLSIYLLIAIGLKGGIELSNYPLSVLVKPLWAGILLGSIIPLIILGVLRKAFKLDIYHSAALAATYGSVSVVTFGAAVDFLEKSGIEYASYMSAIMAVMEIPALLVSIVMLRVMKDKGAAKQVTAVTAYSSIVPIPSNKFSWEPIKECLTGKSVILLLGSLIVGLIGGQEAVPVVKPLFIDLYRGFLLIFLLSMGIVCGQQLHKMKIGVKLIGFALIMPLFNGLLGILIGQAAGLSMGSAALMGVLAASASYIAAPAALKSSVPEASPTVYLGLALGITFPLNLALGIPVYTAMAQWLYS